jgi:outer membrane protein assembly factor BamB
MQDRTLTVLVTLSGAVAAGAALWGWFRVSTADHVRPRLPGEDGATATATPATSAVVDIQGTFQSFDGTPADGTGSWPGFRGPDHDNVSKETVPLASAWPTNGPPVLWSLPLGEGYAGPAIHNGRVYVLDYDEARQADALRCFSLRDGREIWRRAYAVRMKRNHGFSRTVPAVNDQIVVTVGPQCHVLCCDAATGAFRWGLDLVRAQGAVVPLWYTGQCPLLDNNRVILAPAGTNLLIAVDGATGQIAWQTPNPRGWKMSHSSVIPMLLNGRKMYVYFAVGGIAGVAADGVDAGRVLWESAEWAPTIVAPSPVPLTNGQVLLTAGYGEGSRLLQVEKPAATHTIRTLLRLPKSVFSCEQHSPIFHKGMLWTVLPKDADALRCQFVCMRPDGSLVWTSGNEHRFGLGPFMAADDKMLLLNDEGMLTLLAASTEGYRPLAQAHVLPTAKEAWAPMALANGRLVLRDERKMICLDLRANAR